MGSVSSETPLAIALLEERKEAGPGAKDLRGWGQFLAWQSQVACCPHGPQFRERGQDHRCLPWRDQTKAKGNHTHTHTDNLEGGVLSCLKCADAVVRTGGEQRWAILEDVWVLCSLRGTWGARGNPRPVAPGRGVSERPLCVRRTTGHREPPCPVSRAVLRGACFGQLCWRDDLGSAHLGHASQSKSQLDIGETEPRDRICPKIHHV